MRLVPGTEAAGEVVWSPDGERLAYTAGLDALYTIRPDGTDRKRVVGKALAPSWSPDGERIAFMRDSCLDAEDVEQCELEVENPMDIYTVRVDGTELRRLTLNPDYDGDPDWSPDGEQIAFTGADGLYLMNDDGTDQGLLVEHDAIYARSWSPDGKQISFDFIDEDPKAGMEVQVVDVESGRRSTVNSRQGHDFAPDWSPDGTKIVFLANSECLRTGECTAHEEWEVWVMDADGKNARRLTEGGFGSPSWAPKG
jgi:Tol biopolymer transport system component